MRLILYAGCVTALLLAGQPWLAAFVAIAGLLLMLVVAAAQANQALGELERDLAAEAVRTEAAECACRNEREAE